MITLTQLGDWFLLYKVELGFGVLILITVIYKSIKARKKTKVIVEEQPKPENNSIDIDSAYLEEEFKDVNMMETCNIETLKDLKEKTRTERDTSEVRLLNAKKKCMEYIGIGKRLKFHIHTLKQQERMYDKQIEDIVNKGTKVQG